MEMTASDSAASAAGVAATFMPVASALSAGRFPHHHSWPDPAGPPGRARPHFSDACNADLHSVIPTLVSIATDTIPLDGAWYEPDGGRAAQAALLFHGNTMNFYTGAPRFLPPALVELGLACLAFNRRGHDI